MKIEHIILFPNTLSQYDVLNSFTQSLKSSFEKLGISCQLVLPDKKDLMPFLSKIYLDQPDCTLSFNGLLPNEYGEFLCDKIEIPHVCCLVDSAHFFLSLANSPLNIITCPDKTSIDVFRSKKSENCLFMPHAADSAIFEGADNKDRPLDIVFLGSCIDYESIAEKWLAKYQQRITKILLDCAEAVFSDPALPYQTALANSLNPESYEEKDYSALMTDLDLYIRGKDRIELIRSIKMGKVHIFGANLGEKSFSEYLPSNRFIFHGNVNYPQTLEILKQSKIVLNSSPMFKQGGHERIFNGLGSGALVLTNETPYLKSLFTDGEEIALYSPAHREAVDDIIKKYLQSDPLREAIAQAGMLKVKQSHTWDQRAKDLIPQLESILEKRYED